MDRPLRQKSGHCRGIAVEKRWSLVEVRLLTYLLIVLNGLLIDCLID